MTDFKTSVAKVAATLKVSAKTSVEEWSHWTLVHNPDSADTYTCSRTWVVQGPSSIAVTGDMGSMVFERSGGLGLGFFKNGVSYAAEKCAAGEAWVYSPDEARADLISVLQELIDEDESDGWRAKQLAADDIDFDSEHTVYEWYHDNVSSDDVPHLGREPSSDMLRALACIEAVLTYENLDHPR
jgi:hypothetical protein